METFRFNDLPVSITNTIFKNLGLEDKKTARLVCQDWKSAIDKYIAFDYEDVRLDDDNYQYVLNSGVPIKSMNVINFTKNLSFESSNCGNFIVDIESLTFSSGASVDDLMGVISFGTSGINMQKLLEKCEQIKSLRFERSAFTNVGNPRFFKTLMLEELNTLEIELIANCCTSEYNSVLALTNYCHFPRLETLNLKVFREGEFCFKRYYKLYLGICSFIGSHKNTLKSLDFMHPGDIPLQPENIGMDPNIGVLDDSEKIQLEVSEVDGEISIQASFPLATYEMKLPFQTSLQSLSLAGSHELSSEELKNFLLANQSTLQKFDISGLELRQSILFDISWLKNACKLQHLGLGSSMTVTNIQDLPTSLTSLTWKMQSDNFGTDGRETRDLIWITCHLKQLERLVLQDSQVTQNTEGITVEIFHCLVKELPKLQFLHLNCQHDALEIKSFIVKRFCQFGEKFQYCTNGEIFIHRST